MARRRSRRFRVEERFESEQKNHGIDIGREVVGDDCSITLNERSSDATPIFEVFIEFLEFFDGPCDLTYFTCYNFKPSIWRANDTNRVLGESNLIEKHK